MADKDLQQLIDSLKTEGIEAAEAEARKIVAAAERRAQDLEAAAKQRKDELLATAEREATEIVDKGKQALQQAARDLKLALRQEIIDLLDAVFRSEVRQQFSPDLIRSALLPILENVGKEVSVEVPEELLDKLSDYLRGALQAQEADAVLRPHNEGPATFHVRHSAAGWKYEISPETISEALRPYLTQRWLEHLDKTA